MIAVATAILAATLPVVDDRVVGRADAMPLSTVLAVATAATFSGMQGYRAIGERVDDLSLEVLQRFRARRRDGQDRPPSLSAMRILRIRVGADHESA